jgi:hypothetical protein
LHEQTKLPLLVSVQSALSMEHGLMAAPHLSVLFSGGGGAVVMAAVVVGIGTLAAGVSPLLFGGEVEEGGKTAEVANGSVRSSSSSIIPVSAAALLVVAVVVIWMVAVVVKVCRILMLGRRGSNERESK